MAAGDVTANAINPISYQCASFDGVDDGISFSSYLNNSLNFANSSMTISAWIKTSSSYTENARVIDWQDAGPSKGFTFVQQASSLKFNGDGFSMNIGSDAQVNDGSWHHILATIALNTTANTFLDGVSVAVDNSITTQQTPANLFAIGARGSTTGIQAVYFKGFIRDVRIYNVVLTQEEITKLAANEDVTRGLIHNWKLNGDANDSVGTAHGTTSGAVFLSDSPTLDADLTDARTGANDVYLVEEIDNGKIVTAVIEEATATPASQTASPGTITTSNAVGSVDWTNASDAASQNDTYATTGGAAGTISYYLKASNFGFTIPAGATIDGIIVEMDKYVSGAGGTNRDDYEVKLIKADGTLGSTNKATGDAWATSDTDSYTSYGGAADVWGETWTATDINDADFGVAYSTIHNGALNSTANLDHIRITIHYTA